MTKDEIEVALEKATKRLTANAQGKRLCTNPKEFEKLVLTELKKACGDIASAYPTFHPHAFPDIVVNGFGVEVKHTNKNSWRSVGNSIFEGMRDNDAKAIYVIYGKMGGWPEVRWARYEDCVTHVRMSHSPRFVIAMEDSEQLFNAMGVSYADFCVLSSEDKMEHVRLYARSRLEEGERLWWLEDRDEHTLPMAVKIYRKLDTAQKRQYRAECALLCPEIVKGSRERSKYDRAGLYLITQHGVYAPQLRDLFSAGSVGARKGQRGHKYIAEGLHDIEHEMSNAAEYLDSRLFVEYWGEDVSPNKRIDAWLAQVDKFAPDWKPSRELFTSRKRK